MNVSRRTSVVIARWALLVFAVGGMSIIAHSPPAAAQSTEAVKSMNEIIEGLGRTRSLTRGPKKDLAPECEQAIEAAGNPRATRGPSKKELTESRECTAAAPRLDFLIQFELGSAKIHPSAIPQLTQLGKALEATQLKEARLIVAGHTDAIGSAEYNLRLSRERALAVRSYLIDNFAIIGRNLQPIGYGFRELKDAQNPYSGINRRVELVKIN